MSFQFELLGSLRVRILWVNGPAMDNYLDIIFGAVAQGSDVLQLPEEINDNLNIPGSSMAGTI